MVSIRTQMSCGAETSSLALWEKRTERSFSVIRCVGNMSQCEAFSFKVKPIDVETLSSLHCLSYLDTEGIITLFVFMCCCTVWKSSLLMVTFRTLKMHFRSSTVCSGAQSAAQCDECWREWHWHRHTYCCQLSSAVNRICCVHRQRAARCVTEAQLLREMWWMQVSAVNRDDSLWFPVRCILYIYAAPFTVTSSQQAYFQHWREEGGRGRGPGQQFVRHIFQKDGLMREGAELVYRVLGLYSAESDITYRNIAALLGGKH